MLFPFLQILEKYSSTSQAYTRSCQQRSPGKPQYARFMISQIYIGDLYCYGSCDYKYPRIIIQWKSYQNQVKAPRNASNAALISDMLVRTAACSSSPYAYGYAWSRFQRRKPCLQVKPQDMANKRIRNDVERSARCDKDGCVN